MRLLPVFADQLSHGLASLKQADRDRDVVLMMEVRAEADLVWRHRKTLVFLFSAMRHFAAELEEAGWRVRYVRLDDLANAGDFDAELARAVDVLKPQEILLTEPGEWRVEQMARGWREAHGLPVTIIPDDRFVCSRDEFSVWAKGRKELRMEWFYREMRRKTGILMDGDHPAGGQWNYDKENRKPADRDLFMPQPPVFEPDAVTRELMEKVAARWPDRFGDIEPFFFPVTRGQAMEAAADFVENRLARFGDYQDAMLAGNDFLYHSLLSPALNAGLLDPLDLCRMAEAAYRQGRVPLNSAEGFIRQILGWREYVRGIYWLKMPGYLGMNALGANRDLPEFYWSGQTGMACIAEAVRQTRKNAYAHHIQRLMVTGTFALLAGVRPQAVHEWYLAVYADAFEWVELPNTLGMSQYGDGGLMASKPYAASGAYIAKMSDYCRSCRYDVKDRDGPDACPFNALYWDFLGRNREKLGANMRLKMPYATLGRMTPQARQAIRDRAREIFRLLDDGRL